MNDDPAAPLPSIWKSFQKANAGRRLAMSFVILMVAVSLLVFLAWSSFIGCSVIGAFFYENMPWCMAAVVNFIVVGCFLRMLFTRPAGRRLEIAALSGTALSTLFILWMILSGWSVMDRFEIGAMLMYGVINAACPLAFLAGLTFLRRTRWAKD